MTRFSPPTAECVVLTFKDGLLSRVAHDLELRVTRFTVDVGEDAVRAEFDARSLEVIGARRDGVVAPEVLTEENKLQIAGNIRDEVLHTGRHPTITFESQTVSRRNDDEVHVEGTLSLCGKKRPLSFCATLRGERWVAELELLQTDYGIKPYRALMGALKVQDRVRIVLSLPRGGTAPLE